MEPRETKFWLALQRNAGLVGFLAAILFFFVLCYLEIQTVPSILLHILFKDDPSAGLPLGLFVIGAGFVLLPVNFGAALYLGVVAYKSLSRRSASDE